MTTDPTYEARLSTELSNFQQITNVHDLPGICHYWSNKYLLPKIISLGFNSLEHFFLHYIRKSAEREPSRCISIVSLGSGNCDFEVDLATKLIASGVPNFRFTCLEVNKAMLDRGRELAEKRACASVFAFEVSDLNTWTAGEKIDIALAIHSLHHVVELERLFDQIANSLSSEGSFLVHDMIGRNGHQRWSEAEEVVRRFWADLPRRCKFNHQHQRFYDEFVNWDCSTEGFEGIRAQDILPELIKRFRFEVFLGFSNVIDVFIDRGFGHNFNPESPADCEFIDRVANEDERLIDTGVLKPTHILAALRHQVTGSRFYKDLAPEACVRWPRD
ncbi:MAG: methyltransferase domain-containing protein [Chthoniobacterales bacterium]